MRLEPVMKLLPILLLNILTVGAGVVIYDQLRADTPTAYDEVALGESDLEVRVAALERDAAHMRGESAPMLQSEGADPRLAARIEDLERRLAAAPPPRADGPAQPRAAGEDTGGGMAMPVYLDGEEPSADEVSAYRKLQAAARHQERLEREMKRVDQTLKELEIDLGPGEKTKLASAYMAFQERRSTLFRSAMSKARETREAGGEANWAEVMTEARNAVQQEFTVKISSFIPSADAQRISESLNSRGRARGFSGRGGSTRVGGR